MDLLTTVLLQKCPNGLVVVFLTPGIQFLIFPNLLLTFEGNTSTRITVLTFEVNEELKYRCAENSWCK